MRLSLYLMVSVFILFVLGCASSKNSEIAVQQTKELDALMENGSFHFIAQWARPLPSTGLNSIASSGLLPPGSNVGNIDLMGNTNYLKMSRDSVAAYFPYFGEHQIGGGGYPPTDTAIQFDGIPKNLSVEKNQKGYKVKFKIVHGTETYRINAQLFPSKKGNINIISSHRFPIAYIGDLKAFSEGSLE